MGEGTADTNAVRTRVVGGAITLVVVLLAGVATLFAPPAGASGSQTFKAETPFIRAGYDTTLSLPKFDPSLGVLTRVQLRLEASVQGVVDLENRGARAVEAPLLLGAGATFDLPAELQFLDVDGLLQPSAHTTRALQPGSTVRVDDLVATDTYIGDFGRNAFLIAFFGPGDLELPVVVADESVGPGADVAASYDVQVSLRATVTYDYVTAGVALSLTPAAQTVAAGDGVIFSVIVRNLGEAALSDVAVFSFTAPDCARGIDGELAPGAETSYTCVLGDIADDTTVQAAVVARAEGAFISDDTEATVTVAPPSIAIDLSPATQRVASGETATFTVTVANTGDISLSDVAVTGTPSTEDNRPATTSSGCDRLLGNMAARATVSYTCTLTDITADVVNRLTVSGTSGLASPRRVSASATASVVVDAPLETASVDVVTTVNGAAAASSPGVGVDLDGPLRFDYLVHNTGGAVLSDVTVIDASAGPVSCPATNLVPGGSITCTARSVQTAITPTRHTVSVSAKTMDGRPVVAQSFAFHYGRRTAPCPADGLLQGVTFSVNGRMPVADLRLARVRPGDRVTMSWTGTSNDREGCDIALAAYHTPGGTFSPAEEQTLVASARCIARAGNPAEDCGAQPESAPATAGPAAMASGGSLSIIVPSARDGFQLDAITGQPLATVGPAGGFYSSVLGSTLNRLISATNGSGA